MPYRRRSHLLRAIGPMCRPAVVVFASMMALVSSCGTGTSGEDTSASTAGGVAASGTSGAAGATMTAGASREATSAEPGPVAIPAHPAVLLRSDGLGATAFGDVPEYTVAALGAELGAPSRDTTEPAFSSFGTCPGTSLRAVEWGGLAVLITDGDSAYGIEGGPHFFAYLYRLDDSLALATGEGIGLGSTVADLRAAYGTALRVNPEQGSLGASFEVGPYGPGGLYGLLDGTADTSTVTEIAAGQPCGE